MSSYLEQRRLWSQFGKPPKEKRVYEIPKQSEKKKKEIAEEKAANPESSLDKWFEYHMANSEPVCEECGMRADWVKQPGFEEIWRACQAHILPKKKRHGFPSVAGNLDNHMVLFPSWGGHLCGCHGFYDSSWYNATTMKIWGKVQQIFAERLYPVMAESEKRKIPEQLQTLVEK
jgi:hypothetical protein